MWAVVSGRGGTYAHKSIFLAAQLHLESLGPLAISHPLYWDLFVSGQKDMRDLENLMHKNWQHIGMLCQQDSFTELQHNKPE